MYFSHFDQPCNVFYHFVGATPGSTDAQLMLKRLLKEMKVCNVSEYIYIYMPSMFLNHSIKNKSDCCSCGMETVFLSPRCQVLDTANYWLKG